MSPVNKVAPVNHVKPVAPMDRVDTVDEVDKISVRARSIYCYNQHYLREAASRLRHPWRNQEDIIRASGSICHSYPRTSNNWLLDIPCSILDIENHSPATQMIVTRLSSPPVAIPSTENFTVICGKYINLNS